MKETTNTVSSDEDDENVQVHNEQPAKVKKAHVKGRGAKPSMLSAFENSFARTEHDLRQTVSRKTQFSSRRQPLFCFSKAYYVLWKTPKS